MGIRHPPSAIRHPRTVLFRGISRAPSNPLQSSNMFIIFKLSIYLCHLLFLSFIYFLRTDEPHKFLQTIPIQRSYTIFLCNFAGNSLEWHLIFTQLDVSMASIFFPGLLFETSCCLWRKLLFFFIFPFKLCNLALITFSQFWFRQFAVFMVVVQLGPVAVAVHPPTVMVAVWQTWHNSYILWFDR